MAAVTAPEKVVLVGGLTGGYMIPTSMSPRLIITTGLPTFGSLSPTQNVISRGGDSSAIGRTNTPVNFLSGWFSGKVSVIVPIVPWRGSLGLTVRFLILPLRSTHSEAQALSSLLLKTGSKGKVLRGKIKAIILGTQDYSPIP